MAKIIALFMSFLERLDFPKMTQILVNVSNVINAPRFYQFQPYSQNGKIIALFSPFSGRMGFCETGDNLVNERTS